MAFGETAAILTNHQGYVDKLGRFPAQKLVDVKLAERAWNQVIPTQHFGDFHVMVVMNDCQLVGGGSVRFSNDKISQSDSWNCLL